MGFMHLKVLQREASTQPVQKYATYKEILTSWSTDSEAVFLGLRKTEVSVIRLDQLFS